MKAKLFLVVFVGCVFLAAAQPVVTADWVDGTVERMVGSSWKAVDIGDSFGTDATLRLAKGASAELSSAGVRVHLTAPGTYKLTDAFKTTGGRSAATDAAAKIAKLAGKGDYSVATSTTAGVRGDLIDPKTSVIIMPWDEGKDDEPSIPGGSIDPYDAVIVLYKQGSYQEAAKRARDLRLSTAPSAAFRSAYWEAASFFAQGLALPAIKTLEQAGSDNLAPEYKGAGLLAALIQIELSEWDKALDSLVRFAPADAPIADRQHALLLSSVCYESLGKKKDVRNALEAARRLDPNSDLGKEAATRLDKKP